MRTLTFAAALALPLGACMGPASGSSRGSTISSATSTDPGKAEALKTAGVGSRSVDETGLRAAAVDSTKRFEYADVYVSLYDPTGQKLLAPYFINFMKSNPWMLDKCENLSETLRHFRFRRLVGTDGKSLPEVDPLAPKP